MTLPVVERTAAGTVACTACRQEWIGELRDGHADPQCLMWVLGRDKLSESNQPEGDST